MSRLVSFSKTAVSRLRRIAGGAPVALGLQSGGCAGFEYALRPSEPCRVNPLDEVLELDGVTVHVEAEALLYVIGTRVDWVEDMMGSRFVFENPNAGAECGCGVSFTPRSS